MVRKVEFSRLVIFIFFIFFLIWFLLQVISPLILPTGSVRNLSGLTMVSDNENHIEKMPFPIDLVYRCGDGICHQKTDRSFILNDNQMPFCSRCTAIWFGITFGLAIFLFYPLKLDNRFIYLIISAMIPIAIDGFGQLIGFWESTNIIRFITGILIGIVCGLAIGIIIKEINEIIISRRNKESNRLL